MIRLIATDMDGTLLDRRSELPERNVRALQAAMRAGAYVVLASGRMLEAAEPAARLIGVNAPCILFNGAHVYDFAAEKTLHTDAMPLETTRQILGIAEKLGLYIQYYPGKGLYYPYYHPEWTAAYEQSVKVAGHNVGKPLSEYITSGAMKLLAIGKGEAFDRFAPAVRELPGVCAAYSKPIYVEVTQETVSKGRALRVLAEQLGVHREEIMAFGDAENDLDMLEFAGEGYAMENSIGSVLARVARHAPDNDNCGVAQVIEQALMQGRIGG